MASKALKMIKDNDVKFVDLRFTDTRGKEQHVSLPVSVVDEDLFKDGKMFDGSSIAGWKGINESDMILMPEEETAVMDPFSDENTLIVRCDILEPSTMQGYERDPRSVAKRAEAYLQSTGIADVAFFWSGTGVLCFGRRALERRHERLHGQGRLRRGGMELGTGL
jgi:glutamine synthetase